jgi:hypothetical protein
MPLPSEMVFCEQCQNETVDCKHLRREAYLKELRDAAWYRVMVAPAEKYARQMWADQGHSKEEIEFLLRFNKKWGHLGGLREREEARARLLSISVAESRRQDRQAIREMKASFYSALRKGNL